MSGKAGAHARSQQGEDPSSGRQPVADPAVSAHPALQASYIMHNLICKLMVRPEIVHWVRKFVLHAAFEAKANCKGHPDLLFLAKTCTRNATARRCPRYTLHSLAVSCLGRLEFNRPRPLIKYLSVRDVETFRIGINIVADSAF
jgi:hypothetical protein